MKDPHQYHQYERTDMSDEWYTPDYIVKALGFFDLDPCASCFTKLPNITNHLTILDNGLNKEWNGRVFLNPPYSRRSLDAFVKKLAKHNNGIALLYSRVGTQLFQRVIFPIAHSIFFFEGRIRFMKYNPDDNSLIEGGTPGADSCLIAFGEQNTNAIRFAIESKQLKGQLLLITHYGLEE